MEEHLKELLIKSQSGDTNSFGQIYELYIDRIYRFVYLRTHHKQIAEDLTSDIFFKAHKGLASFNPHTGNFTAWIYTIARNRITDFYRTHKSTADLESAHDLADKNSLEDEVQNRILLEKIKDRIKELSEKDQEIITLRVWDGLSHKDIARIIGGTENAIKVSYLRAMRKLHANLNLILLLLTLINI